MARKEAKSLSIWFLACADQPIEKRPHNPKFRMNIGITLFPTTLDMAAEKITVHVNTQHMSQQSDSICLCHVREGVSSERSWVDYQMHVVNGPVHRKAQKAGGDDRSRDDTG